MEYAFPDDFPEVARDLVEKCLQFEPWDRIGINSGFQDLKNHAFFEGIDFNSLNDDSSPLVEAYQSVEEANELDYDMPDDLFTGDDYIETTHQFTDQVALATRVMAEPLHTVREMDNEGGSLDPQSVLWTSEH